MKPWVYIGIMVGGYAVNAVLVNEADLSSRGTGVVAISTAAAFTTVILVDSRIEKRRERIQRNVCRFDKEMQKHPPRMQVVPEGTEFDKASKNDNHD